jgi:hypothetical protein
VAVGLLGVFCQVASWPWLLWVSCAPAGVYRSRWWRCWWRVRGACGRPRPGCAASRARGRREYAQRSGAHNAKKWGAASSPRPAALPFREGLSSYQGSFVEQVIWAGYLG